MKWKEYFMNRSIKITSLTILMAGGALQAMEVPNAELNEQLLEAAYNSDKKEEAKAFGSKVQRLLAQGADINAKTSSGQSVLMTTIYNGNTSGSELLLKLGADINAKDNSGYTSLFHCAEMALEPNCKFLIAHGANVDELNLGGKTALMRAVVAGAEYWPNSGYREEYTKICEHLLNAGADYTLKNNQGENAFSLAVKHEYTDILQEMINRLVQLTRAEKNSVKEWLSQAYKMKLKKGIDIPKDIRLLVAQDIGHLLAQNLQQRIISASTNTALELAKKDKKNSAAQLLEQYLDIRFLETLVRKQTGFPKQIEANEKVKIDDNNGGE